MFKVIVAGGRDFTDYALMKRKLDKILANQSDIQIVSGKQRGADTLGEQYARENSYPVKEFPADWLKFGRKAGPIRNREMAEYADALVAFWDGVSRGTGSMIDEAKKRELIVRIINY